MEAKAIRKHAAQHDLFNRIHSIASDEGFVRQVAEKWYNGRFEVVPNQRCGNWYCDPSSSSKAYAYFKSTDGHTSNWDFNLRRSNLPFASYMEQKGGIILVDSTRRGKRMPDGLSKTVPIWCAVINLAIALRRKRQNSGDNEEDWDTSLYLPSSIVSPSEKAQIESCLLGWAVSLDSSVLPLPDLHKPLRPFFIHPSTSQPPTIPDDPDYTPIICLSASRWVNSDGQGAGDEIPLFTTVQDVEQGSRTTVGFEYVPGAGDDDELWGRGLTPRVFHLNKKRLLAVNRDELPQLVDELVASAKELSISTLDSLDITDDNPPHTSGKTVSSSRNLVGIPKSTSPIYADMGPPISSVLNPEPSQDLDTTQSRHIIIVCPIEKPPSDEQYLIISQYPTNRGDDLSILLVPDPKSHGREYMRSIRAFIDHLKELSTRDTNGHNSIPAMMIRPGSKSDLESITSSNSATSKPSAPIVLSNLPSDLQNCRKEIIPLLLVVLCSFPELSPSSSSTNDKHKSITSTSSHLGSTIAPSDGSRFTEDGADEIEAIDKATIARHLHTLVALWPDSNPPRAALKRVNEFLMADVKRT